MEFDLYCGDGTFGAPGQGDGGSALSGSFLHYEPWSQSITPIPNPIAGASGADVVRPNLSIGKIPRNFYGPSTGVIPNPGVATNMAISSYTISGGTISVKPNKIWTVSIGGDADSYLNLPAVPPGTANHGAGYSGGGNSGVVHFIILILE